MLYIPGIARTNGCVQEVCSPSCHMSLATSPSEGKPLYLLYDTVGMLDILCSSRHVTSSAEREACRHAGGSVVR